MTMQQQLLTELTEKHPQACQLLSKLIQAIDLDARQRSEYPEVVNECCLSELPGTLKECAQRLSENDLTGPETDHAVTVVATLISDLQAAGLDLKSIDSHDALSEETVIYPLNYHEALEEFEEDDDFKLFVCEVGLIDMADDPGSVYTTEEVAIAAENADSATGIALQKARELIPVVDHIVFTEMDSAREIEPLD